MVELFLNREEVQRTHITEQVQHQEEVLWVLVLLMDDLLTEVHQVHLTEVHQVHLTEVHRVHLTEVHQVHHMDVHPVVHWVEGVHPVAEGVRPEEDDDLV